jgi:hypothetical protein
MWLIEKIVEQLKVSEEVAKGVLYEMNCGSLRFSEATNAQIRAEIKYCYSEYLRKVGA